MRPARAGCQGRSTLVGEPSSCRANMVMEGPVGRGSRTAVLEADFVMVTFLLFEVAISLLIGGGKSGMP